MKYNLVQGDLFKLLPYESEKAVVVPHICNTLGVFGSGFVIPLAAKWPNVKQEYVRWHNEQGLPLGETQFVKVRNFPPIVVANMIGQDGIKGKDNPKPIRYLAVIKCMQKVADYVDYLVQNNGEKEKREVEIHCPKFGAKRAGGSWTVIEELIEEIWLSRNIPVTVYELA